MSEQDALVERVAEAICTADTTSWKHTDDTTTTPDVTWAEMRDDTEPVPYEGISLGRDHYRGLARAAIAAVQGAGLEELLGGEWMIVEAFCDEAERNPCYARIQRRVFVEWNGQREQRAGWGDTLHDATTAAITISRVEAALGEDER